MACPTCGRDANTHHLHPIRGGEEGETEEQIARNGIVCGMWGPPRWYSLHVATINYPFKPSEEQKRDWTSLIRLWKNELPCCCCRKNYQRHLNALFTPKVLEDRESMVQFGFDLHNAVNKQLGKHVLTQEELRRVRRLLESGRAGRDHPYGHATVAIVANKPKEGKSIVIDSKVVYR